MYLVISWLIRLSPLCPEDVGNCWTSLSVFSVYLSLCLFLSIGDCSAVLWCLHLDLWQVLNKTRHEIDYLEHTRWLLKDTRRRTHNLTWFGSDLAYVREKRTWERFINKLDTKWSNFPLNTTRVFTFPLNLCLDYKNILFSMNLHFAHLFLSFLGPLGLFGLYIIHHNFLLLFCSI